LFDQLRSSENLKIILQLILAFGNYMNAATPKGGAQGFKLSALLRLKASKSVTNSQTLLTYLVRYVQSHWSNQASPGRFHEDLATCEEASRIEAQFMKAEINKIGLTLKAIQTELADYKSTSPLDKFHPIMTGFHEAAYIIHNGVKQQLEATEKKYADLLIYFGETGATLDAPPSLEWEEFFAIWAEFVRDYAAEEKRLVILQEKTDKENREMFRKQQRAKAKSMILVSEMKEADKRETDTLDSVTEQDADDIGRKSWSAEILASLKSEAGVREMKLRKELGGKRQEEVLENMSFQSAKLAGAKLPGSPASSASKRKPKPGRLSVSVPIANCKVCGCSDFAKHKFRTGTCSRCMHAH